MLPGRLEKNNGKLGIFGPPRPNEDVATMCYTPPYRMILFQPAGDRLLKDCLLINFPVADP